MSLTQPSGRRLRPVQLRTIPLEQRLKAAAKAAQKEPPAMRAAILHAALAPSDTTYWVRP